MSLRRAGITTFVCLQSELQPQDTCTADEPAPASAHAADTAPTRGSSTGIPDREPAASLEALDGLARDLAARVHSGEALYIHCWAAARAAPASSPPACSARCTRRSRPPRRSRACRPTSCCARAAPGKSPRSPETDAQEAQVRAWFAEWRPR